MIKNERQYRITKAEAERFQQALSELDNRPAGANGVHPLLQKAERDALASQLEDLQNQLREYEELQSGRQAVLEVNSLAELPRALVQARIAANMSQKELAERLGMKEQQVQRYESTDYAGANLARLQEVCEAIGINIRKDVFMRPVAGAPERLFKRFKEIGFDKEFVYRRLVPTAVADRAKTDPDKATGEVIFHATSAASRIFGWTPSAILGTNPLPIDPRVLATARFKVPANADETKLSAYTVYAHYLALLLLEATADLPVKRIPTEADEVRAAIIAAYGEITFANAVRYVWSLGVPVLPLKDSGAFHGACWRVAGRNVIVLKQRTSAIARWLHDNLHEFRHAGEEPDQSERTIIEAPETSPERRESDEEVEATMFASDVVLDGRAEELAKLCVQATKKGGRGTGRLQLLTSVVPDIADREGVPTDALANYMAFRLSLQGENWWGPAMNLQRTDEDPWRIARDILLENAKLSRLSRPDRDLLARALTEE